jgi:hypothetical protein
MKKLIAVLKLFPVILAAVRAVEEAIPLPGQGSKKLDLILDVVKTVYDGGNEIARDFSWDKLVAIVVPMIAKIVDLHNQLGLFTNRKSKPNQA